MHRVKPAVHVVARTQMDRGGLKSYLETIGVPEWESDAEDDIDEIIEVMGRGCYMSFGTELNPNVTRVRESNKDYIENIVRINHGSVLEHGYVSFMFTDVSRVFTHELVTHRVGMAKSQESLRFVRLTNLGLWIPSCFANNSEAVKIFESVWTVCEAAYAKLLSIDVLGEDIDKMDFARKKELTSAARRVAPIGLATNIGWSCNIRTLRYVINQRTAPEAEEEIRVVFQEVARIAKERWPNLFADIS